MASIEAHFKQAQGNQKVYLDVLGGETSSTPEWAMTALFYSAVHYVQAGCVHIGTCPKGHTARKEVIETHFRAIAAAYSKLYQDSRDARYECFKHRSSDLRDAESLLSKIAAEIHDAVPDSA